MRHENAVLKKGLPTNEAMPRGATTAEKLRRDQGLGPNTGPKRPAPGQRPRWVLDAGGGRPLALYHPRKIFENSDAKSCILVTTCCETSCFLKNTAKKLGGLIHCWSRNLKVGDQSSPVPTVVAPMATPGSNHSLSGTCSKARKPLCAQCSYLQWI